MLFAGLVANLVQVIDVGWDRDVGRVAIVQEMRKTDLDGDGPNNFAEAWHLQVFHLPDLEHQRAKVFADEIQLAARRSLDRPGKCRRSATRPASCGWGHPAQKRCRRGETNRPDRPIATFSSNAVKRKGASTTLLECGGRGRSQGAGRGLPVGRETSADAPGPGCDAGTRQRRHWANTALGSSSRRASQGRQSLCSKNAEQVGQVGDRGVRVILYRLPKMFGGIVGRAVELDPFFDRIPVGEHPRRNGWGRAPAVQ